MGRTPAAIGLLLAGIASPAAAQTVALEPSIPYGEAAEVPARLRETCGLERRIPAYVREYAADVRTDVAEAERRLRLRIEHVHAPAGGMWSGPKWIDLEGELLAGERSLGRFRARRTSLGGPFAPFLNTCEILNRCARALGRDVAAWLAEPTPDARLGDAR